MGTRYGISFSADSVEQPDSATAPPPVTPRTLRKRRRSMPSIMLDLVVTRGAILGHLVLLVTIETPTHLERRILIDAWHFLNRPVTGLAGDASGLHVPHVREMHKRWQLVDLHPLDGMGRVREGRVADFLHFGIAAARDNVTAHTGPQGGHARVRAHLDRVVAVAAVHL